MQNPAAEARSKAVSEAKAKVDDMAKLAKEAEEDAKKAEKEAKSANQPESKEEDQTPPPPIATTRVQPDAVTISVETTRTAGAVPPKERSHAGSRSPRRSGASGSSSSKPSLSPEVRAAMAKPARERGDEEILLAGSVAKAAKTEAKTESWADSTEEMLDDSLQN